MDVDHPTRYQERLGIATDRGPHELIEVQWGPGAPLEYYTGAEINSMNPVLTLWRGDDGQEIYVGMVFPPGYGRPPGPTTPPDSPPDSPPRAVRPQQTLEASPAAAPAPQAPPVTPEITGTETDTAKYGIELWLRKKSPKYGFSDAQKAANEKAARSGWPQLTDREKGNVRLNDFWRQFKNYLEKQKFNWKDLDTRALLRQLKDWELLPRRGQFGPCPKRRRS